MEDMFPWQDLLIGGGSVVSLFLLIDIFIVIGIVLSALETAGRKNIEITSILIGAAILSFYADLWFPLAMSFGALGHIIPAGLGLSLMCAGYIPGEIRKKHHKCLAG